MSIYSADMQKLFSGCRSAYSYTAFKVFEECPLADKPIGCVTVLNLNHISFLM